jgi:AraC-like DNA-binding protein
MGAPVERLLQQAGIPPGMLDTPDAVVRLQSAYRFAELACQTLHSEHIGLHVGLASSLDDFGAYGTNLKCSHTIGDYLQKGIASYSTLTTGERLSLTDHGSEMRLNIESPGYCSTGMYQAHLCAIAVTIASIREFTGPHWSPGEIALAYKSRERLPSAELFEASRVLLGRECSYITVPKAIWDLRLPAKRPGMNRGELQTPLTLPEDIMGLVVNQIEAFSAAGHRFTIETIAESLAMSRRTLQRAIADRGFTYSQLLSESRLRRAVQWLDHTNKPINEIARQLGYTDAANFSRAFRRRTGLSPSDFRDGVKRT